MQVDPRQQGRDALEGKGPQGRPQRRLGRRLEEVAEAVGGGYCRLQMPLKLALGVRGTVAGHRLGALERGCLPPFQCIRGRGDVLEQLTAQAARSTCSYYVAASRERTRSANSAGVNPEQTAQPGEGGEQTAGDQEQVGGGGLRSGPPPHPPTLWTQIL